MDNINTIIVSLTALLASICGLLVTFKKVKKEVEETIPAKIKRQTNADLEIINKMEYAKEILGADRVQIYDFHNGGHYANGRSALKTSCTYEVVRAGVKKYQRELQAVPLSCIPHFVDELLRNNSIEVNNLEDIINQMPATYSLKREQSIKSFYDVVLENDSGEPIGFLGVQYTTGPHHVYTEKEKREILKLKFFIEEKLNNK